MGEPKNKFSWQQYAGEIWRDSSALWAKSEHITKFAGIVLGSLLLSIFVVFGIAIQFKAVAGMWVSGALLLLLIFLIFVASPFRLWRKKSAEIEALKSDGFLKIALRTTMNSLWLEKNRASVSIAIENISDATIRDVFVELDRFVEGNPILNLPRKLRPRDEPGPKFDLAPHKTQYVLVGTVELEPNSRFEWQFVNRENADVSVAGKYVIKLKAYGDGIQPENRFIPLSIEKDGSEVTFGTASIHTDPPLDPERGATAAAP